MPGVEKISIALPADMIGIVRGAVAAGEYASTSEAIREALRDWTLKRRRLELELSELRQLIREGLESGPSIPADQLFNRLKAKYAAMDEDLAASSE
jgi:antitoxin ParD1/3/4